MFSESNEQNSQSNMSLMLLFVAVTDQEEKEHFPRCLRHQVWPGAYAEAGSVQAPNAQDEGPEEEGGSPSHRRAGRTGAQGGQSGELRWLLRPGQVTLFTRLTMCLALPACAGQERHSDLLFLPPIVVSSPPFCFSPCDFQILLCLEYYECDGSAPRENHNNRRKKSNKCFPLAVVCLKLAVFSFCEFGVCNS